jgi:hypothetical protein
VTLEKILLKLWKLRLWVGVGGLLAVLAAVASLTMFHSAVYSSASTKMLVDSPQSALANASVDLTGYLGRADVFARLMTSAEALQYIGQAAGVPGNLIAASGPVEVNGSPGAAHAPVAIRGGRDVAAPANYKLQLLQNPLLPTVDVYAEAPTTERAIALANGAVTGFGAFMNHLYAGSGFPVAPNKRIEIRSLGGATGGVVDPGASKKIAAMIFLAVLALWCGIVLFVDRLLGQMRPAKTNDAVHVAPATEHDIPHPQPAVGRDDLEPMGAEMAEAGYSRNHTGDRNQDEDVHRGVRGWS